MTPRDLADESGHVNIKTFLEEERSHEKIGEFPRNISMMDVSVLLAVHWYCWFEFGFISFTNIDDLFVLVFPTEFNLKFVHCMAVIHT